MDGWEIVFSEKEDIQAQAFSRQIGAELQLLHIEQNQVEIRVELQPRYAVVRCKLAAGGAAQEPEASTGLKGAVGSALAGYILEEKEPLLLRELVKREYRFDKPEEQEQIVGYCRQLLYGQGEEPEITADEARQSESRRKGKLALQISAYMEQSQLVIIDGVMRFRLPDYMEELREVAEYAIDEFMMDKQYQEFISLLQYFVYIQDAKIPAAHLIHKGGHEFMILNDRMEQIDANEFDATFKLEVLDKDINFEDMIVSTLITVSPATIYIHTREPEMPVIKTITQIFEDRTTLCGYCRTCSGYLGDGDFKQDQLSP
ncbi:putative sporulation protein YtxC [Paenibacillus athensensis]|nr:putative sporulation protein YtxC [Paenibacillus athensensis]MCD1260959.1 putative sporulation protein YtxC [Paenibacillus athensensis]